MGYSYIFYKYYGLPRIEIISFKEKDVHAIYSFEGKEYVIKKYKSHHYFGAKAPQGESFHFTDNEYFKTLSEVEYVLIEKIFKTKL